MDKICGKHNVNLVMVDHFDMEKRARIKREWQRAFKKEQHNNNKNMFLFITSCNQKNEKKMTASLAIKKTLKKAHKLSSTN